VLRHTSSPRPLPEALQDQLPDVKTIEESLQEVKRVLKRNKAVIP